MDKQWLIRDTLTEPVPGKTPREVSRLVAAILASRGIESADEIRAFLAPALSDMLDPFLLRGMPAAVDRLMQARLKGEPVCVYGDYDVDGITGTALLVTFLRAAGFNCSYFIPNRFDDGYGLNACLHRDHHRTGCAADHFGRLRYHRCG